MGRRLEELGNRGGARRRQKMPGKGGVGGLFKSRRQEELGKGGVGW